MRPELRPSRLVLATLCAIALIPAYGRAQDTTAAVEAPVTDVAVSESLPESVADVSEPAAEPYYGYDGLRLSGGSGLTYTLGARTLGDDGLAAGGSLTGMKAPSWIRQVTNDTKLTGGLLRETFNVVKAIKGAEFWAAIGGTQSWRVTEQTEKLSNLGDIAVGAKYSFTLAPAWSLAPYVHVRMLSPVQNPDGANESKYTDTLSPELGIALGWYGWSGARQVPLALTMNLSYDYDRTLNLLSEDTRADVPAKPFERLNWGMSDFPFVRARLGMEWLAGAVGAWSAELLGDLPLISDETSASLGRYRGVLGWRRAMVHDWLLLHAFVSGSAPVDTDIDVEQLPPYEMGVQLSVALGGFKHGQPAARMAAEIADEPAVPVSELAPTAPTEPTDVVSEPAASPVTDSTAAAPAPAAQTPAAPVGESAPAAKNPKTQSKPKSAPTKSAPASPGANDYDQPIEDDADVYQ